MQLSLVQKVAIGNIGQVIGIVALLAAFWGTSNSLQDISDTFTSASERTSAHIGSMASDIETLLNRLEKQATQKSNIAEMQETLASINVRLHDIQKDFQNDQDADTEAVKSLIDGATGTGLATMIGRVIWQVIVLSYFLFLAKVMLERPLNRITESAVRLADDELDVEIPETKRGDEIGKMARAVEVFKTNALETKRLREGREKEQQQAQETIKRNMLEMADSLDSEVQTTVNAIIDKSEGANSMAENMMRSVEGVNNDTAEVSSTASEASTNVDIATAATNELSHSLSEISEQVENASRIASGAVEDASQASSMVQELQVSASKIGDVVALITDIAEQTNLLALNATIEAARAGDAGKGFAVVASEVKNLANQTAKATEEIDAQIRGIQGSTQETVRAIENVNKTVNEINETAQSISTSVSEQNRATKDISSNVTSAASATQLMTDKVTGIASATEQSGQMSREVQNTIEGITNDIRELQDRLTNILRESAAGNRRSEPRQTVKKTTRAQINGQWHDCTLNDVSEGGAEITRIDGLSQGDTLTVEIPERGPLQAVAKRITPKSIGMQFEAA
jgi:methyl-accepting chemotaxis protein